MKRGLGSPNIDPATKRAVQQAGNRAQAAAGKRHRFRGKAAVDAGRKGGLARARRRDADGVR